MGFFQGVSKAFLVIFNLVVILIGILFTVFGSIAYSSLKHATNYTDFSAGVAVSVIFILVGVSFLVVSFLGCCGAIKEHECMLTTYALVMIILAFAQIAGYVTFVAKKSEAKNFAIDLANKGLENYKKDNSTREAVDGMQWSLHCCGVKSAQDWNKLFGNNTYPQSCCDKQSNATETTVCHGDNYYKEPCDEKIDAMLNEIDRLLMWAVIFGAGATLVLFSMACFVKSRAASYRQYV